MRYLTTNQVLLIHERILDKFGGAGGLRDWGLLDSAVNRLRATFDGEDLYPDIFTKAVALGHFLVLKHPFADGNKRTAWETMKRFLAENDIRLKVARGEIVDLTLRIEDKSLGVEHIASWFKDHSS